MNNIYDGKYGQIIIPGAIAFEDSEEYLRGLYVSVIRMEKLNLPERVITTFLEECSKIKSDNIENILNDIYDWEGRNVFEYVFADIDKKQEENDAVKFNYNKKTNTIEIDANLVSKNRVTLYTYGSESDFDIFVEGVEKYWNQDNVNIFGYSTNVKLDGKDNNTGFLGWRENINVSNANYVSWAPKWFPQVSNISYGPFVVGKWTPDNVGDIRMVNGHYKNYSNAIISKEDYMLTAAHEFGHILGIGDGYNDLRSRNSIMDDQWNVDGPQSLDYEKMIGAFVSQQEQKMEFGDVFTRFNGKVDIEKPTDKDYEKIDLTLLEIIEMIIKS